MNLRPENSPFKIQLILSVLIVVVAIVITQKSHFLNDIYLGKQLASVASGPNGCYFQSDIDNIQTDKKILLDQSNVHDDQLNSLEQNIEETVFQMRENERKIEELRLLLIPEDKMQEKIASINNLRDEISKIKNILDIASATSFQKKQISEKEKSLNDLNDKINQLNLNTGKLAQFKAQLKVKNSIDAAYVAYLDAQNKAKLIDKKYTASVAIDKLELDVLQAENLIKSTRTSGNRRSNLHKYNTLKSELDTLIKDFDTKYGEVSIVATNTNLNTRTKVLKKELDDAWNTATKFNKEYSSLSTSYNRNFPKDKNLSAIEISANIVGIEASIVSMEEEYKNIKVEYDEIKHTYTQSVESLDKLKKEFENKNTFDDQKSYEEHLVSAENKLKDAQSTYDDYVATQNKTLRDIQVLDDINTSLFETLKTQTTEKANLKADKVDIETKINQIDQDLIYATQNICTTHTADMTDIEGEQGGFFGTILNFVRGTEYTNANLIPIQSEAPTSPVTDRFLSLSNLLESNIKSIKQQNETSIVPVMRQIQIEAEEGAYTELSALMDKVQQRIDTLQTQVAQYTRDVETLKAESDATTSDVEVKAEADAHIVAANSVLRDYLTYFKTLESFLVDEVPTPELYSTLAQKVSALENSTEIFEVQSSKLTSLIDSKQRIKENIVYVKSITPTKEEFVPYYEYIDKISVEFNKPIEEYLGGTITIKNKDDITLKTTLKSVSSGDTFITAAFQTPEAGQTYSIVADLQLQFDGKAHGLNKTWRFNIDGDPTQMVGEKESDVVEGSDESEDTGGEIKKNTDICCVCVYGDRRPGKTFKKTCSQLFEEKSCTRTKEVYDKATDMDTITGFYGDTMKKTTDEFYEFCPADEYDTAYFMYEEHGQEEGEEYETCANLPIELIESYSDNHVDLPENINIIHDACNAFDDINEAKKWAEYLREYLKTSGRVNIKITITGNQNNGVGGDIKNIFGFKSYIEDERFCQGKATITVCSEYVKVDYDICPEIGSLCSTAGKNTFLCKGADGKIKTRRCVKSGEKVGDIEIGHVQQ